MAARHKQKGDWRTFVFWEWASFRCAVDPDGDANLSFFLARGSEIPGMIIQQPFFFLFSVATTKTRSGAVHPSRHQIKIKRKGRRSDVRNNKPNRCSNVDGQGRQRRRRLRRRGGRKTKEGKEAAWKWREGAKRHLEQDANTDLLASRAARPPGREGPKKEQGWPGATQDGSQAGTQSRETLALGAQKKPGRWGTQRWVPRILVDEMKLFSTPPGWARAHSRRRHWLD